MVADGSKAATREQPDGGARPLREKGGEEGGRPRPVHWAAALALLPLGLLGAAAWFGRFVRPGADDWCFLPFVRDEGISGLIAKFYFVDNGRIANAALTGLYAKFDIPGHQWFPVVSGALTLGVLWAVTASALRAAGLSAPRGVPLLLAAMVTAVFLLGSPNTYKTFYWPASAVSHTVAPALPLAAAIVLLRARSRRGRIAALVTAVIAGIVLGTLSEESSVVALVVLSSAVLLGRQLFPEHRRAYVRAWCLAGIAGTGIGILVLLTSPGSRNRRMRYDAEGTSMFAPEQLIESLHAFARILGTLLTTWTYLGAVAAGVLASLLVRGPVRTAVPRPRASLLVCAGVLVFLVSGYLCTVVAFPAFGPGIVVVTRSWNDYLLLYTVLLAGAGALLGHALRRGERSGTVLKAAGAAGCVLVCVAFTLSLSRLGEDMRVRAADWDRQDRWMRAQAALGARQLPYKPLSVSGMGEPFGKHGSWPADCVADYYYVDRVVRGTRLP
ncbi:DUF6056 family protein [Streptomyces jumonjinensis]|uniref:Uncharacterized protein n=1 Tax=Streptomyces jumonjinensis TaxID=1945 RepID=A0A646K9B2_STRJU|nr:DUF6056 family protein [Streptomyces jumonjinensis]MQS98762.1 hypothetical protein [Streptomyces jumonjinensis]